MKDKISNILLIVIFVAGLSLLLYPTVSNYYNAYVQSQVIVDYSQQLDALEQEAYLREWEAAEQYNRDLLDRHNQFDLTAEQEERYWSLLDLTEQQIMAYIEIPTIGVTLPIAHGTDEKTLSAYVGHLEWSSLPVGGESTHCVISGHRGLPSSELFTNIDHLEVGDRFYLHVLGKTLEYQVDNVAVVEPQDVSLLGVTQGKDYMTLVTCTPYGINSHRLLVRGVRIGTRDDGGGVGPVIRNEVTEISPMVVVPVVLVILAAAVFLVMLADSEKHKAWKKEAQDRGEE